MPLSLSRLLLRVPAKGADLYLTELCVCVSREELVRWVCCSLRVLEKGAVISIRKLSPKQKSVCRTEISLINLIFSSRVI